MLISMKSISRYLLGLLLVGCTACEQDGVRKLQGEWLLHSDYEAPDLLIFRSDGSYLVYNDLDFQGIESNAAANIRFDNDMATALTEVGIWSYNDQEKLITLKRRKFLLENSEFNQAYGKGEPLNFKVKKLSGKELVICTNEDKQYCDTYLKNFSPSKEHESAFYKEVSQEYSGLGDRTFTLDLSGYETSLRLTSSFCAGPVELILENKKHQEVLTTNLKAVQKKQGMVVPLLGVTQLTIRVSAEDQYQKWQFQVEIR